MRFRHIKRGTRYTPLSFLATLQCSTRQLVDGETVTVYAGDDDGRVWVRSTEELTDGRFDAIEDTPIAEFERRARWLVERARESGLVLTIEQRPLPPLAMGNLETVVSVRPIRFQQS